MKKKGFTERAPQKRLNDGVLYFGEIETKRKHGEKVSEEFKAILPLRFDYAKIRQSDYDVIGATGQIIDLKVKTYYTKNVNKSHKVKIDKDFYDIYRLDPGSSKIFLYWYLQKVGRS